VADYITMVENHSLHGSALQNCFKGRARKYRKWHFWGCCRGETP